MFRIVLLIKAVCRSPVLLLLFSPAVFFAQKLDTAAYNALLEKVPLWEMLGKYPELIADCDAAAALALQSVGERSLPFAEAIYQAGRGWALRSQFDTAMVIYERALQIRSGLGDTDGPGVAAIWHSMGYVHFGKGDFEKSIEVTSKALALRRRHCGEMCENTANSYNLLGNAMRENGRYRAALENLKKAYNIRLKIKAKPQDIAGSLTNIGITYFKLSEFDSGKVYLLDALAFQEKLTGKSHPVVALICQNLGFLYDALGMPDSGCIFLKRAWIIFEKRTMPGDPARAPVLLGLGNNYKYRGQLDSALALYRQALEISRAVYGEIHPVIAAAWLQTGLTRYDMGQYHLAVEAVERAYHIYNLQQSGEKMASARCLQVLGEIYERLQDPEKSLVFLQKALAIKENTPDPDTLEIASTLLDLGMVQRETGDFDAATSNLSKAAAIFEEKYGPGHFLVATSYLNLGKAFEERGKADSALMYGLRALKIFEESDGTESPRVATANDYIGTAYLLDGKHDLAIRHFSKSLDIRQRRFGFEHPAVASSHAYLAQAYRGKNEPGEALVRAENCIHSLGFDGNNFGKISELPPLLAGLRIKAQVLLELADRTDNPAYTREACNALQLADSAAMHARQLFFGGVSRELLSRKMLPLYETAIAAHLRLHDETAERKAFAFAEKSKSLLLLEAVRSGRALRFEGVPDSLTILEHDLDVGINLVEKRRHDEEELPVRRQTVLDSCNRALFDLINRRDALEGLFRKDFPDYFQLRHGGPLESVESIRRDLLRPGQALLEYFAGDSSLFIFVISDTVFRVQEIHLDFPLVEWVKALRRHITAYHLAPRKDKTTALYLKHLEAYAAIAHQLYQKLLAPVAQWLPARLIIVPDGVLGYVPFEALLATPPKEPTGLFDYDFLLKRYQISYCYSAALLREMSGRQHPRWPDLRYAAFAPVFYDRSAPRGDGLGSSTRFDNRLSSSRYNVEEVQAVARRLGGDGRVFIREQAIEAAFVETAPHASVLHLATHAAASDKPGDYSRLAFTEQDDSIENEWLYAKEIYNLPLAADLVVLSACETGVGEIKRGEGIISLARAFAYAGAGSIITSLWMVEEDNRSILRLMDDFYRHLTDDQMPKDKALQQAKLDFIEWAANTYDTKAAHPFFWAGFVGIGNMQALKF